METWNLFQSNDILLGLIGGLGLISVFAVLISSTSKINDREVEIQKHIRKAISDMEPEDRVLVDPIIGQIHHLETQKPEDDITNMVMLSSEQNKLIDDAAGYDTYSK